ncbi:MAG: Crp/Fnr family transcriptional regulator [Sandaracinus sp.]|nr:Crp/Fnr family transcriptional regulator [Sandaracinus sp.]MCB9617505.1 Crp/Fnr family transcriptional regulator [Sandaracinus sp.]MCB9620296.1 Crp/Fnr family transcriptional regulator [Sandaracinus sp.]
MDEADDAYWTASLRVWSPALDAAALDLVRPFVRALELSKGAAFLETGEVPTRVATIRRGVVRELFVLPDGTERTRGFGVEGAFAGSLSDLLRAGPSRTRVVAEEDTRLLVAPWDVLRDAGTRHEGWRELLHRVTERLYLLKAEREVELLSMDAEARYAAFRARFPGLEARIAQRHVASYLGITPEHLSRLRARGRAAKAPT